MVQGTGTLAAALAGVLALTVCNGTAPAATDRFAGHEAVVRDTHRGSLALRRKVLRDTVAVDSFWIKGTWGDTLWCLAALYLNEMDMAVGRPGGPAHGRGGALCGREGQTSSGTTKGLR